MFGFGRKAVSPQQAVQAYIAHVAATSDKTFNSWMQVLIQGMANADIASAKIKRILNAKNVKIIHFAALCAIDALAIRNCFDPRISNALYEALHHELQSRFGQDMPLGDLVFLYLQRMEAGKVDAVMTMPHDEAAFMTMELLGFGSHKQTKGLFQNPIFVMSIGIPLMTSILGWWKSLSQKAKVKS